MSLLSLLFIPLRLTLQLYPSLSILFLQRFPTLFTSLVLLLLLLFRLSAVLRFQIFPRLPPSTLHPLLFTNLELQLLAPFTLWLLYRSFLFTLKKQLLLRLYMHQSHLIPFQLILLILSILIPSHYQASNHFLHLILT